MKSICQSGQEKSMMFKANNKVAGIAEVTSLTVMVFVLGYWTQERWIPSWFLTISSSTTTDLQINYNFNM